MLETSEKQLQAFSFHGSIFLGLTYIFYPTLSLIQFRGYVCESIDEARLLSADLSIDCDSAEHVFIWWFAVAMALVYPIGIPCYFAYKLIWQWGAGLEELKRLEEGGGQDSSPNQDDAPKEDAKEDQSAPLLTLAPEELAEHLFRRVRDVPLEVLCSTRRRRPSARAGAARRRQAMVVGIWMPVVTGWAA